MEGTSGRLLAIVCSFPAEHLCCFWASSLALSPLARLQAQMLDCQGPSELPLCRRGDDVGVMVLSPPHYSLRCDKE